jgi:hypothetical protein
MGGLSLVYDWVEQGIRKTIGVARNFAASGFTPSGALAIDS